MATAVALFHAVWPDPRFNKTALLQRALAVRVTPKARALW